MDLSAFDNPAAIEVIGDEATPHLRDAARRIRVAGTPFDAEYLAGRADSRVLRQRDDQLRTRAVPARFVDLAPPPHRARATAGSSTPTATASRGSSSRSRRTWIPTTAIASRSFASAPVGSPRTW